MEQKDLLGGKGANLAEMRSVLGLPVPPGFTITTDACRAYLADGWPEGLEPEVAKALRQIARALGKGRGGAPGLGTGSVCGVALVSGSGHNQRRPPMAQKDLLGGKGANLAEMGSVLGLPVPPGFTITTDACRAYLADGWPEGLDAEVAKALRKVERAMGKKLGDAADPLLVSVRSGAKQSMPGMMDTVLNLDRKSTRLNSSH